MKSVRLFLFDLLAFAISFGLARWVFMEFLYYYLLRFFGFPDSGVDFWRPLVCILFLSLILFSPLQLLYRKRLPSYFIPFLYLSYVCLLLAGLFFKNRGIRGLNLDLLAYIRDSIYLEPLVLLINCLLFLPLGLLYSFSYKRSLRFLGLILVVEVCQYLFWLGFCDIGDLLTNWLGFLLGNWIHPLVYRKNRSRKHPLSN